MKLYKECSEDFHNVHCTEIFWCLILYICIKKKKIAPGGKKLVRDTAFIPKFVKINTQPVFVFNRFY